MSVMCVAGVTALGSAAINFLEADVSLVDPDPALVQIGDVIMSHPPKRRSDLTLTDFLEAVAHHNTLPKARRKDVKLDFKDPNALDVTLLELGKVLSKYGRPAMGEQLWLNADILSGPGGKVPRFVDAGSFIQKCREASIPGSKLSLGWTTKGLGAMLALIHKHKLRPDTVTFPLSAFHAYQRPNAVRELLAPGHSVTFFGVCSSNTRAWLEGLQEEFPNRVFVDVRGGTWAELVGLGVLSRAGWLAA